TTESPPLSATLLARAQDTNARSSRARQKFQFNHDHDDNNNRRLKRCRAAKAQCNKNSKSNLQARNTLDITDSSDWLSKEKEFDIEIDGDDNNNIHNINHYNHNNHYYHTHNHNNNENKNDTNDNDDTDKNKKLQLRKQEIFEKCKKIGWKPLEKIEGIPCDVMHGPPGLGDTPQVWCRYCGSRVSEVWYNSETAMLCSFHRRMGDLVSATQTDPIDPTKNKEIEIMHLNYCKLKVNSSKKKKISQLYSIIVSHFKQQQRTIAHAFRVKNNNTLKLFFQQQSQTEEWKTKKKKREKTQTPKNKHKRPQRKTNSRHEWTHKRKKNKRRCVETSEDSDSCSTTDSSSALRTGSDSSLEEDAYEVEKILDDRIITKSGVTERQYLIHWLGYDSSYNTWEPESNLNCDELLAKYKEMKPIQQSTTFK
ncbi:hypothetical protein RFI_27253, partial [Reticulomyxa filosa]